MAENVPVSIWQPTDGNSEFSNAGVDYIVDTTNVYLIDPSGTFIVDTGVLETLIPASVWLEDDSK